MKRKWLGSAAAVSILAAVMLSGCGSTNTSSPEKSGETKAPAKGGELQVGMTQIVEHPSLDAASKGFKAALEEKGLKVKYDMQIAGDPNNTQTVANNFVSDKVDLIFANSTPSALGALNATKDIPVVFTSVTDPLGAKLVSSMEAPGGNVTGTTDTHPDAIPKTVEFISKQMKAKKVGTIYNAGEQNSVAQVEIVKKEMKKAGIELAEASVSTSAEVKQAAESLSGKVDAFYVITDNTVVSALESVIGVANDKDIPLFVGELDSVARGGFAAYGFDYYDIGFEAGEMAAQILADGKKPADLPVQYPQKLKLSINEKAAKEMGIEIKEEWKSEAEIVK
ncbi:BMP family ABC transporter substrate-binding protein [Bacillus sp. M6-12]|uniref:ABC transporter substrate-binding protein n=1 Tax=Bacillus sp. M6-12 TaxID=2054166 RepID=UPI000C76B6AF|nr:ABC transporter substrate-binding protein [Bacillus sp. M6-12]PLS18807.1 BMP family ABC transporter substrate-binding protein [Bacillus sp. M6-12]